MIRALLAWTLAGCVGATEIVITVDSELGVPCTIDTLVVEVTGDGTVSEQIAIADADLPGSITIVPDGDGGRVDVTITGLRDGEPFAVAADTVDFLDRNSLELRFVLDRTCIAAPCPAVGRGTFRELPERVPRRGCGLESYENRDATFVVRDACEMSVPFQGRVLTTANEQEAALPPMPFPFRFYGQPVTHLHVGDNGYLAFSEAEPRATITARGPITALDTTVFPVPGVMPFWDDLKTGAKGICYAASGALPDRVLWVTWKEACFASGPACGTSGEVLTFTVALEETTDRIYFGYHAMVAAGGNAGREQGLSAAIGIKHGVTARCGWEACSPAGTCPGGEPCGFTQFSFRQRVTLPNLEVVPL